MRVYQIIYETSEPSLPFPIVEHRFRGVSKEQAEAFVCAHEKSDAFFRECGHGGLFAGKVRCMQRRVSEGWVNT